MDSLKPYVMPLNDVSETDEKVIGGKASKLAKLVGMGYRVPSGFCVTIYAYNHFIETNRLDEMIAFELGRKRFQDMRWEEIWDAALRIRSSFLREKIPAVIRNTIMTSLKKMGSEKPLAVRSSAPKEDTARASFAGLHESYIGVTGMEDLLNSIRLVWASLWSDAALLYQKELGLDPLRSSMAVVVQELVQEDISGVAFGCDPTAPEEDKAIIEAVPGLCQNLVDGTLDPDRWLLRKSTGEMLAFKPGDRGGAEKGTPLLESDDLKLLYRALQGIETLFGWQPDLEWTGRNDRLTLLQARPITTSQAAPKDDKSYYLTLRPNEQNLKKLAQRVSETLIPQLEKEGEKMAAEDLSKLNDRELSEAIETRQDALEKWKKIYWDEFIPFAHGVRRLATYYNDAVRPQDPYEFIGLLRGQAMRSTQRNRKMMELSEVLRSDPSLLELIRDQVFGEKGPPPSWQDVRHQIHALPQGLNFVRGFESLLEEYMDVSYGRARLKDRPELVLKTVVEMAISKEHSVAGDQVTGGQTDVAELEKKLFRAVGQEHIEEAKEVLRIGRMSWRLRDDDNLLLGRIESQLLRAVHVGVELLRSEGRLQREGRVGEKTANIIIAALRNPSQKKVIIPDENGTERKSHHKKRKSVKSRQLIGQPAAPGLATGPVCRVLVPEDFGAFKAGNILVCDAIQPNMTHLVPLAGGIIERRGGMLIHGAIIARELGVPCVNGVPNAVDLLEDGELVTVDGHLGIVTVGEPEFDLERDINKIYLHPKVSDLLK
ncbi:MAG: hypothetical protein JSV84_15690 [Gemmatimonadota bacterium]|nr:MAG: hypothetical protein JSV84_15690 [Gemmatimonadota bacterium]